MYGNVLDTRFLCIMRLRKELIERYENVDVIDKIIEQACIKMARSVYYQEYTKSNNVSFKGRLAMYMSESYEELELFTEIYEYQCIGEYFSYPTQIREFIKNPYNLTERKLYLKWITMCQTPTFLTNVKDILMIKPTKQKETIKIRMWFLSKERYWSKKLDNKNKEYWRFTTESIDKMREYIKNPIQNANEIEKILYDVPINHKLEDKLLATS